MILKSDRFSVETTYNNPNLRPLNENFQVFAVVVNFVKTKINPLPLLEMMFGNVVGCYKMAINQNFFRLSENQYMAITAHQNAGKANKKNFSVSHS